MKLNLVVIILAFSQLAFSQALPLYYGQEFLDAYQNKSLKGPELRNKLFEIISEGHIKVANAPDTLVANCDSVSADEAAHCEQHHAVGYDEARNRIFGQLYLEQLNDGSYGVTDVYCNRLFTDKDFKNKPTFGPGLKPISGDVINTEHTWPQSRFGGRFPVEMQKSDLHHLFPTDSKLNSVRSSLHFGNVVKDTDTLSCPGDRIGHQATGEIIFEPPQQHKGNVARAIFYFATRYQMKISRTEEAALREWNKEDPVDAFEYEKNNKIEQIQGNRNPYIDFPELIDDLPQFQ